MGTTNSKERYVIYVFDGFKNDRRFEFPDFLHAYQYFKRFVREDAQVGMFHHNAETRRHKLLYRTDDFPLCRDRSDVVTFRGGTTHEL